MSAGSICSHKINFSLQYFMLRFRSKFQTNGILMLTAITVQRKIIKKRSKEPIDL